MKRHTLLIAGIMSLCLFLFSPMRAQTAASQETANAQNCFAKLDAGNNFTDNLKHVDMNNLPTGIKKTVGNMDITLAVNSLEYGESYNSLGVYLRIKIPEKNKTLFFGAQDIKLSHDGDIIGDAKITLMGDFEIPFGDGNIVLRLKGGFNEDTGRAADLTFATIDCNGFKELGISAEVEFSPDLSGTFGSGSPVSSTSVVYVPEENNTLGIKASVMFAVPKRETLHGEATFELMFNNKGGLSYAGFYGYAKFAGAIPGLDNFRKMAGDKYNALLEKEKEFTKGNPELTKTLTQMKQYNPNEAANAMTDKDKVQGQNGIMATVGMQFNFAESSFHATFELYANLPGEDPANLDYMSGLNSLGAGSGFAFGANLSVSTGDLTFLILYANYSMGPGFDVMLKDYGDAQCKGRSGETSVFTAPQATFNMPIEKAFNVQDDEGEKTFRIKLRDFRLIDGRKDITGELKFNKAKDAASFCSHEILPPQKNITAIVKVVFEVLIKGRWFPVYTAGKEAEEVKTVRFTTSDAPKDIPAENVLYAYPVIDRKYFLKDEAKTGYIRLRTGQSYLFPTDLKNQVVYEDAQGNKQAVDFKYDETKKRIDYTVPNVNNKTAYAVKIVSMSAGGAAAATDNTATNSMLSDSELGSIDVSNKQAAAETRTDLGKTLLSYEFAASAYSTFSDKINSIRKKEAIVVKLSSDVYKFKYETEDMEAFDLAELVGTDRTENKPLVAVQAATDGYYYSQKIYPLLYKDYPAAGRFSVSRSDAEEIGVPPLKALPVIPEYLTKAENSDFTGIMRTVFPYYYNLPQYFKADFIDLQSQAVNGLMEQGGETYRRFAAATFPFISAEQYKINMQYEMPGGVKGTTATFEYKNFIK